MREGLSWSGTVFLHCCKVKYLLFFWWMDSRLDFRFPPPPHSWSKAAQEVVFFLNFVLRTLLWIFLKSDDTHTPSVNSLWECEYFRKKESFPPASLKTSVCIFTYFCFLLHWFRVPAAELWFIVFNLLRTCKKLSSTASRWFSGEF